MKRLGFAVVAIVPPLLLLPEVGAAHTYGAHGAGLVDGIVHPFGGLDHLLAMIAVGLWAVWLGGRALWLVPSAFLVSMVGGGFLALVGLGLPAVEPGILGSVLVIGALVAFSWRVPTLLGMGIVGTFALFHGYAHGAEMPGAAAPALYTLGFVLSTAALQGVGIGLGLRARSKRPTGHRIGEDEVAMGVLAGADQ